MIISNMRKSNDSDHGLKAHWNVENKIYKLNIFHIFNKIFKIYEGLWEIKRLSNSLV